jgi:exosortase
MGRPVLERLIGNLAEQGIRDITVCCNGDGALSRESINVPQNPDLALKFLDEPLPVGTAGSVRDATQGSGDRLLLVIGAGIVCPPNIGELVAAHCSRGSDLTVVFNPPDASKRMLGQLANVYLCGPNVLEHIPVEGYYDIKESLIPELVRAGKRIHPFVLRRSAGNFRDRGSYLQAIGDYLENGFESDSDLKLAERNASRVVWTGRRVNIEPGARLYGKVVMLEDSSVADGAVIFGPTIVGRGVYIGSGALVADSIIWDGAKIGRGCEVQRCLVDFEQAVPDDAVLNDKSVVRQSKSVFSGVVERVSDAMRLDQGQEKQERVLTDSAATPAGSKGLQWVAVGLVSAAFLWSYWPGILDLWRVWNRSDEYSSGLLVPFLAVYLLWSRRRQITGVQRQSSLWGLLAFVTAQAVRFFGLFFMYGSAERLSIVLSVAALVLLLFGWEFFRKVSPIVLFLLLMLPWPNRVQAAVALPLQRWATSSAVFCLEVVGYEVVREGNIINIGNASVAVAEACNGLRMVTAFFVISGLVALLVERTWWEKLIVFVSSLPVALFCNTVRLAITAIAFTVLKGEYWEKIFHDFGGYAMMPLALAIAVGELWFLAKLTMSPKEDGIIVVKGDK